MILHDTPLKKPLKLTALLIAAQGLLGVGEARESGEVSPEKEASPEKELKDTSKSGAEEVAPTATVESGARSQEDAAKKLDSVVVKGQAPRALVPEKVSSPKYPQPLLDTAKTIQIIPQEVIKAQAATSLQEVLRNTPGIMMATGEGGNSASSFAGDSFYMRGFDTSGSIFVDGVRNLGAYSRDMFNYEQAEVVKGPAGENGRGVASGYINLVTKTPSLREGGEMTASYGSSKGKDISRRRATLDYNTPVADSPFEGTALRFNGLVQEGGVAGRDHVENNSVGLAPSLAIGLGTDTRVVATYQYLKQNNTPDYGVPTSVIEELAGPGMYVPGAARSNYYGLDSDRERIESHTASLRFEHDFSDNVKFTNILAYGNVERDAYLSIVDRVDATPNPTTVSVAHRRYQRETNNLSNLSNLLINFKTGTLEHTVTTGFDASFEDSYIPTFPNTVPERETGVPIASPDPGRTPPANTLPGPAAGNNKATSTTFGLYAYDSVKFDKRWIFDGGARLDYYNNEYKVTNGLGATTTRRADDWNLSWKAALTFKPAENGSIYAAAGTAVRTPGTNLTYSTGGTNIDNPALDPQISYNFEVGTKWEFFDGRFAPALALFRNESTNIPYTDPVSGQVEQNRDQIVQGVEISATGWLTDSWSVYGGFAYMHTDVTRYAGTGATAGNHMGLAPEFSGSLWTSYRFPFGLTLGGGVEYVGRTERIRTVGAGTESNRGTIPAYWLVNLMAAYDVTENFTVQLNVNNVLDEEYVVNYNDSGRRAMPGAPRNYTVSATYRF